MTIFELMQRDAHENKINQLEGNVVWLDARNRILTEELQKAESRLNEATELLKTVAQHGEFRHDPGGLTALSIRYFIAQEEESRKEQEDTTHTAEGGG